MSLRTWVFAAYMLYCILCQDGHVLTIKIYLKICGRPSKFADQNLRCPGSKPVLWPRYGIAGLRFRDLTGESVVRLAMLYQEAEIAHCKHPQTPKPKRVRGTA